MSKQNIVSAEQCALIFQINREDLEGYYRKHEAPGGVENHVGELLSVDTVVFWPWYLKHLTGKTRAADMNTLSTSREPDTGDEWDNKLQSSFKKIFKEHGIDAAVLAYVICFKEYFNGSILERVDIHNEEAQKIASEEYCKAISGFVDGFRAYMSKIGIQRVDEVLNA